MASVSLSSSVRILIISCLSFASFSNAVVSGIPLFDYEQDQLTDDDLAKLPPQDAALIAFDDTAVGGNNAINYPSGLCKTYPGDSDWPLEKTWNKFHKLVDNALISTVPAAAPCYQGWSVYDKEKCAEIQKNYGDLYFHENDPTSVMFPIYQGMTCLPPSLHSKTTNLTCTLGSFPPFVVNISSVSQIQATLNFARNHNVRLVIKNTGHDYLGKSLGAGGLSVWTHNLKNIEFVPEYQSDSGYKGPVLKVGAGVTVREVYKKAHEHNVTALGGICESVGFAGGYIAGGGHTPMSGYYGMAADNVEALEVVTADGRFIHASNTSHPDLYWALRGGGGSTFGIVTSVTIRAHPKIPIVTSKFTFSTSSTVSKELFWKGTEAYFREFIRYTDAHTYSYFWIWNRNGGKDLEFQMTPFFAPNHTLESFNALVQPWFNRLKELGISVTPTTTLYDSFYPAYNENWGNDTLGGPNILPGNRLFPRGNWEDPEKFNRTIEVLRNHSLSGRNFGGYHQAPRNRLNVDNAVSSAFRHVISFLIGAAVLEDGADSTKEQLQKAAKELTEDILGPWRQVAPEKDFGGSYLNEANVMEPGWQESFYGDRYPRLLKIKKQWDPKGLFYGPTTVGSEGWEVRDGDWGTQTQNGRLCRV